jgi:hypothetical protein
MMQDTRTKRRGRKLQQKGGRQLKGSFYFIAKEFIFNAESNRLLFEKESVYPSK